MDATRHNLPVIVTALMVLIFGVVVATHVTAQGPAQTEQVIRITARQFEYVPAHVTLKKGVPVVLEFTSEDVTHGFSCPDLKIRVDIFPRKITTVRFVPDKEGRFPFHCDNFCGSGHENMMGTITVK